MKWLRWLPSGLLLLPWLLVPPAPGTGERIRDLAAPVRFRLLDWETEHLAERAGRLWNGLTTASDSHDADTEALRSYFATGSRRDRPTATAEAALERVVAQAYRDSGVTRSAPLPAPGLFPPVLVALTSPPNVLVISPRTELRVTSSSVLQPMDVPAQERLESSADSNGVSSLVAPIGGLATYPSMVLEEDSAARVLASVAHEWMHQYLVFYPLGAQYWSSQETREINETTAELIGQEVGSGLALSLGLVTSSTPTATASGFDFRGFMRETRLETERLLHGGRVEEAEAYMRARQDELRPHGYSIRKLNQAYFALYGSYGEGFAASPANPIPDLLHALRNRSPSLADFIFRVRQITSVAELRAAAG